MKILARSYDIPVVESYASQTDIHKFIEDTKALLDTEGFVIAWNTGARAKAKCDWYVKIHRAKDALSSENKILDLYFHNQLDDLLAALSKPEQEAIRNFCGRFDLWLNKISEEVLEGLLSWNKSRKEFALEMAPTLNPYLKPVYLHAGKPEI